jgi:hypothetical protein
MTKILDNLAQGKYTNNLRNAYHLEEKRLTDLFQADLEEEYGVVGNSRAANLFEIAWREGSAESLANVLYYYDLMVGLIQ